MLQNPRFSVRATGPAAILRGINAFFSKSRENANAFQSDRVDTGGDMLARSSYAAQLADANPSPSSAALQRPDASIFLLEDNDLNAKVLKEILRSFALTSIERARSLAEAQKWLPEIMSGKFDLVIADILLPDGQSLPMMEQIVVSAPAPVALYTGRLSAEDRAAYASTGVSHVFEKPVTIEKMRAGLAVLLGE